MNLKVSAQPPPRRAARRSISGYLVFWVLLATAALGYLGLAATRPDVIVARLSPGAQQTAEPTAADRRTSELADELVNLRRWLTDLQREFAETRATVVQQASTEKSLVDKVATIEDRLSAHVSNGEWASGDQAAKSKSAVSPGTEQVLKAMAGGSAEPRTELAPARTAASAEQVARKASGAAPIATGAIPSPAAAERPIAFGPAKVTPAPAGRALGIELTGAESLEALRSSWDQLARQHDQVLQRLTPRYRTALQGEEQPLRLVAGPFASQAEASRACAALRSKQVACRIGAFTGNAL
jgi:hypothetical protein